MDLRKAIYGLGLVSALGISTPILATPLETSKTFNTVMLTDKLHTQIIAVAAPASPLATPPGGVTASTEWVTSCAHCGGMPMAHNYVTWAASAKAASYNVYRNGLKIAAGIPTLRYTDMNVGSNTTYRYAVTSVNSAGESALSAISAVTAAGAGPGSMGTLPPTNLVVGALWKNGATDALAWSPAPGAVAYNVYQYDVKIASNLKTTVYTLPVSVYYNGLTYTVTAIDSMGMESIPSAIATAQGGLNPHVKPSYTPAAPGKPTSLICTPEWNNGAPRIRVSWDGVKGDTTYDVFRDGVQVASGVWGLNYFDSNVAPGDKHRYAVCGVNIPWTAVKRSSLTASVAGTAPLAAPALRSAKVHIVDVAPDDDSVTISFQSVPGAVDYRCYDVTKPSSVKYSGGGLSIEMNSVSLSGADFIVEAVDKYGPFQKMDGGAGPGAMTMNGGMNVSINGVGDPSNIPNVIARSDPFTAIPSARILTGDQVFFDNFRASVPFTQDAAIDPAIADANGGAPPTADNPYVQQYSNDKWTIRNYFGDMLDSRTFVMSNHFMDTLYDGGTPGGSIPMHNCNASLVLAPNATADISGGRVLHVTMEVDAHFDNRRWCEICVGEAGDPFIRPGKLDGGLLPTVTGNMFRWDILGEFHSPKEYIAGAETNLIDLTFDAANERYGPAARIKWDGTPLLNGDMSGLDNRHQFDLYISQTHFRIIENGQTIKDADLPTPLPFTQIQPYFVHQIYHTANDRPELMENGSADTYWINNRPWCDERHWDNLGFEVLPYFPS